MSFAISAVVIGVVGAGISAAGAVSSSNAQKKAGKYGAEAGGRQKAQSEYESKIILEKSQEQARQVRAQAINVRGTQIATAASSGVLVGDGSSQDMVDEVSRLSEQDAVAYLWDGANGSISATEQGRLADLEGQQRAKQANAAANATLVSGFGSALTQLGSAGLGIAGAAKGGSTASMKFKGGPTGGWPSV